MERAITGYHQDDVGDWVAELACGHRQHVRHRPPFTTRAWVVDEAGRQGRLGMPLNCPLCDRSELPDGLYFARSTPQWDEQTMPRGLRRAHRVAAGVWGRITVAEGQMRYTAGTTPATDVVLGPGGVQAVPPEVTHDVEPLGPVRFSIDFLTVAPPAAEPVVGPVEGPARAGPVPGGPPDD